MTFSSAVHARGNNASQDGMGGASNATRITVAVLSAAAVITTAAVVAASASSSQSSHA